MHKLIQCIFNNIHVYIYIYIKLQVKLHIYIYDNVLLVKINGPVWYTIFIIYLLSKGYTHTAINQPKKGNRTSMYYIYICMYVCMCV